MQSTSSAIPHEALHFDSDGPGSRALRVKQQSWLGQSAFSSHFNRAEDGAAHWLSFVMQDLPPSSATQQNDPLHSDVPQLTLRGFEPADDASGPLSSEAPSCGPPSFGCWGGVPASVEGGGPGTPDGVSSLELPQPWATPATRSNIDTVTPMKPGFFCMLVVLPVVMVGRFEVVFARAFSQNLEKKLQIEAAAKLGMTCPPSWVHQRTGYSVGQFARCSQ